MGNRIHLVGWFRVPRPFKPAYGEKAKDPHRALDGQDWIEEVCAASGGIGCSPSSLWVFRLKDYGALDRLQGGDDPVSQASGGFFRAMDEMSDFIREEVTSPDCSRETCAPVCGR